MKKFRFLYLPLLALMTAFSFASCSDDNKNDIPDDPTLIEDYHFDLWVALDRHGGMARDVQTLVRSLGSLDADQPEINFEGKGTEVNAILSLETIYKGAYYYQVPVSGDRFAKYRIENNRIITVAERRFKTNTFSTRKYTHAWIDDNTLVIMAASGDAKSIIWTKLNAEDMSIIDEGTLDIAMPEGGEMFTTSGILNYRKQDNKLFYFYYAKSGGKRGKRVIPMTTAVINPATMTVESNKPCFLDCEMVGSAYGELLQTTTLITDNGDLYIACVTDDSDGKEHSHLLRIPAGSTDFEEGYDGCTISGKLISLLYIGGKEALAYARDDEMGTSIDDFSHYYTVLDLNAKTSSRVMFEGKPLDYSGGRFSSRMAYVNHKAYIGVDAKDTNPQIYIYDVATKTTIKGASMASGYYFEQIRVVEDVKQ
ncbi:MAG: hypothetical protein K2H88_08095 [Duncaniella sp.]|nr:hypothetical protein [Duncaniella sp.]MDE5752583.1 hypothetical protein [Duncaniella sp.]MDE5919613.1 hypothetical protein [Duncaniella sp.]MDE6170788.1 hypothetical protein [Duncaniella sp.]MDE6358494.1 hypothetical protein [Duncaniella sp.]